MTDKGQDTSASDDDLESNNYTTSTSTTYHTQGDADIERLLGVSPPREEVKKGSEISPTAEIPDGFRNEIEKRRSQVRISSSVARYYLEDLVRSDSSAVPGHRRHPSLLQAVLTEDTAALVKDDIDGLGWKPVRTLGRGTYGAVILWRKNRKDRQPLWLATKDTHVSSFFRDYCSEAHLTRRLNDLGCKNVINVVEWKYLAEMEWKEVSGAVSWTEPKHRIAYEYAEYGDLHNLWQWYQAHRLIFPEEFIWHILHSLANALCFCSRGTNGPKATVGWDSIVHGDIKQENIFLTAVDTNQHSLYPTMKMADFGIAYTLGGSVTAVQHYQSTREYGTDGYIAPEVLNRSPEAERRRRAPHELHGPHSDIFSLGMTVQKCLTLLKPHKTTRDAFTKLVDEPTREEQLLTFYSPELRALLQRCMEIDPRDRPKTYTLYRETRAQMEMHRDQMYANEYDQISWETILFTKAHRMRYENDPTFRDTYRKANLQPLYDYLQKHRTESLRERLATSLSGSTEGPLPEDPFSTPEQQVDDNDVGCQQGQVAKRQNGFAGLWRKFANQRL